MKALARRIASIEGKAKPIMVTEQFNSSMIDPADLEWLMVRCSPDRGINGHASNCRCYYCQPQKDRISI